MAEAQVVGRGFERFDESRRAVAQWSRELRKLLGIK